MFCGKAGHDVEFRVDPYLNEIMGDDTKYWICDACAYDRAQDI